MRRFLLLASLCGLLAATAAPAAPVVAVGPTSAAYAGPGSATYNVPNTNDYRKRQAILAVAREGRELQSADGGSLTAAHLAYLQAKLNAIQAGNY